MGRAFPPQEGLMKESPTDRPADVVRGDPDALSKAEVIIVET